MVFVTKYALTAGIRQVKAEICSDTMIRVAPGDWSESTTYPIYFHGKDWHVTLREAQIDAEKRLARRIASLEKQLKGLRKMSF